MFFCKQTLLRNRTTDFSLPFWKKIVFTVLGLLQSCLLIKMPKKAKKGKGGGKAKKGG